MDDPLLPLTGSLALVDEMYARYAADPTSVDATWRRVFEDGAALHRTGASGTGVDAIHDAEVSALVNAFRVAGHLESELDPLGSSRREPQPELDPKSYGFSDADLDAVVPAGGFVGLEPLPLRDLVTALRQTYCGTIGVEFMHIARGERRRWLQARMEPTRNRTPLDSASQTYLLDRLVAASELERFIEAKYVGAKRFSLEGGETLIPLLDLLLERAGELGAEESVLGMAHRGRLNVLVNLLGMSASHLFSEFEDFDPRATMGGGDVKYHLGYSCDHVTRGGRKLHLSLSFNPSHLEAVDPVVVGRVRAKQRRRRDARHERVVGVLIHGDAAFAGQGLVAETLNLYDLRGYRTGGTVHVVVNNQIGFTTSPTDSRSTPYCTDVAKMIQVPIFHVNGDDPEAVAHVAGLAMEYRKAFASDVVIDMFCFRRYGHNEVDEPSFTQPLLYERIKKHPAVYEIYGARLVEGGVMSRDAIDERVAQHHRRLGEDLERARSLGKRPVIEHLGGYWAGFAGGGEETVPEVDTGVPRETLTEIGTRLATVPSGFHAHPKIVRLIDQRLAMARGERPLDWAMAEAIAFGTIACEPGDRIVRMSGQDCRRGTFSQRHAVIVDVRTGEEYVPLQHLRDGQSIVRIYDSSLSEAAVLGFEFGYSLDYPESLVVWEAQFGDFANGAQVIIDQFICSSEDRWKRLSGLVMLLPHGYEGQGPEHSSARMERYLTLSAEDNWQICYPTTPAQYFHLLRRQVLRRWRKPLVVMTPKSMLRLPAATSSLDTLVRGGFERVLGDPAALPDGGIERVILCTGKVFYDLDEERRRRGDTKTALLRIEQLYPLPDDTLARAMAGYEGARELVWVQEEPANMGAYRFLRPRLLQLAGTRRFRAVTRVESASPATGSAKAHALEQRALLDEAFT